MFVAEETPDLEPSSPGVQFRNAPRPLTGGPFYEIQDLPDRFGYLADAVKLVLIATLAPARSFTPLARFLLYPISRHPDHRRGWRAVPSIGPGNICQSLFRGEVHFCKIRLAVSWCSTNSKILWSTFFFFFFFFSRGPCKTRKRGEEAAAFLLPFSNALSSEREHLF